jgi:hypothetical protein
MKKLICFLSILLVCALLVPPKQAEAWRGGGWFLPGLIVGGALAWGLAPRYYYPPAYYYPPPAYYYPPPAPPAAPPAYYNPPPGEVSQTPPSGGQLFIYPRQGQSQEKQASDRNECHGWAVGQTGYDPTKPPPDNMTGNQMAQMSSDYQRAMGACLDARGYTMR